jgi:predicted nuclease of predicted toxin-antitoxin system
MRFIVDAQLPPALAQWLSLRGHEAEHVLDQDMQSASDTVIWDYAVRVSATIITKDEDFGRRRVLAIDGPSIVWIRVPNTRRAALLSWFENMFPDIIVALKRGEALVEVR